MKNLIPADTIDAEGHVWETVGENIRNGAKHFSAHEIIEILQIMYPIGSVYVGDSSFLSLFGSWKHIGLAGMPYVAGTSQTSGSIIDATIKGSDSISSIVLNMWKRVS